MDGTILRNYFAIRNRWSVAIGLTVGATYRTTVFFSRVSSSDLLGTDRRTMKFRSFGIDSLMGTN